MFLSRSPKQAESGYTKHRQYDDLSRYLGFEARGSTRHDLDGYKPSSDHPGTAPGTVTPQK